MKKLIIVLFIFLAGCADACRINSVRRGMTRDEVIEVMGAPVSVSAINDIEYLNYKLLENPNDFYRMPYFVRIINNKVESFGRSGDFNSENIPTIRIEKDETIRQNVNSNEKSDLYTEIVKLKELRDQGLLTQDEFETKKKEVLKKY